ncbi:MAG: RNA methyltransferase [Bacteroidota bacterium]|nr:RNA methyltransferase [Bacteroidota bacterium]
MSISSASNPQVKRLKALGLKSNLRKKENVFLVEGKKEITFALQANYDLQNLFYAHHIPESLKPYQSKCIALSARLLDSLLYRKEGDQLLAVFERKNHPLEDIQPKKKGLYLILEGIEKPGNVGAILRTADATKVDAIVLSNPQCDLYSPNCIRSSLGCVFLQNIAFAKNQELLEWLKKNDIKIFATDLQNTNNYLQESYTQSSAFIFGAESSGISDFWKSNADKRVNIAMLGKNDSLNVSVTAAVIAFEAKRQRMYE